MPVSSNVRPLLNLHIAYSRTTRAIRSAIATVFLAAAGPAMSADLKFDQKEADEDSTFRQMTIQTRDCMNESARAMLRLGERESERVVAFQLQACGGPLTEYMTSTLGRPTAQVASYARALAYDELNRIPGLSKAPESPTGETRTVEHLSEAQFDRQFRCPESYSSESESKQALANMLKWYAARNPKVTVDEVISFRMKLLEKHGCRETLRNIENAATAPSVKLPTYNSKSICRGKKDCIDGEMEVRAVLENIWPKAGARAKEYCAAAVYKANNTRYLNLLNCLAAEDK